MDFPLVSVIVPNYNNSRYLEQCLDSLLEQTYKNFEIIISDDASTDESKEILQKYENRHDGLSIYYQNENMGVARNRHFAIQVSSGEFITTVDSDDYYADKRKLESEMGLILEKRSDSKEIISFSNIMVLENDTLRRLGNVNNIKEGNIVFDILTRTCMIPRDFTMSKSAYFTVGGYNFRFPIYEDWDLKIRLSSRYEFYYTGADGVIYRSHGDGLSAVSISENIYWLKQVYEKNIHLIEDNKKNESDTVFNCYLKGLEKYTRDNKFLYFYFFVKKYIKKIFKKTNNYF